ncbi:hypothetical protein AN963_21305 [Brevibacillus choshinensis]|uniref:HTH merR-type domain-containing protein n=1 Tax=Brevibacillus choshinensis TaxID=54911 RepID=A0ABR5N0K8_BRECH|nr:MerR family transcriptional regulator [Brevibacillus choshinensis]KQL43986.1 hypothetical protein AN963_21305 [Brevibacillus choshinensis]
MENKTYAISEIAGMLQITKRTLRFYDQIGLLTPSLFSSGGHRLYTSDDIEKLYKIRLLKGLGLNLKQVKLIFEESKLEWEDLLRQQLSEIDKQLKKYKLMQEIVLIVQRSIKLEGKMDWENLFRYLYLLYEDKTVAQQHTLHHFITEDELHFLRTQLPQMKEDDPRTNELIELFSEMKADDERDPASAKAQVWAEKIVIASDHIFKGREELREKVWRIQRDAPELAFQYPIDPELIDFIEKALTIYREKNK